MVVSCTSACHPHTKAGWRQMSYCCGILAVFGVALLITSAILPKFLDDALYSELDAATIINGPNVPGYEKWANNKDDPILLSTYIIDILNPADILNGSKPIVAERGPYVYREYKVNYNVTWTNDGDIIKYHQYKYYVFQPQLSVESDTDVQYTTINMAFIGIASGASHGSELAQNLFLLLYTLILPLTDEQKLFTQKTPREIIFGWSDPGLAFLQSQGQSDTDRYPGSVLNMTSWEHADTLNKTYVQYTGYSNVDRIRHFIEFENMTHVVTCYEAKCPPAIKLPAWGSEYANRIRGTDGSQWKRDISPTDTLEFFYSPTFRAVNLVHKGETSYRDVPLYKYHLPETMWQNSTLNPANADYYQFGPSGMLNMTVLSFNSTVFVTYPRMEGVDESVRNQVIYNSTVDVTAPETVFFVEPISGAVFFAETSSQGVLYLEPLRWIPVPNDDPNVHNTTTWFPNLKPVYFPLFWASETGGISEPDAKKFNDGISLLNTTKKLCNYAGIPISIICVLVGIYCTWRSRQHHYRHPGTKKVLSDTLTLLDTNQTQSDKLAAIKIDDLPAHTTSAPAPSPYGTFKPANGTTTSPTDQTEPTTPESQSMNHNGVTLYQSP